MRLLDWSIVEDKDNLSDVEKKYPLKGELTGHKLVRYLPALIATNISTMLLVTVDGLVAGNMVGSDALASISFFNPIETVIGALTAIISMGASTVLSIRMGNADTEGLNRIKDAIKKFTILYAIILSIIQIPIVFIIINSYNLSGDVLSYTVSYAIGIMIATPFSVINTVGVYQLQAIGKMKVLVVFAIIEGGANLAFDVLFVGVFNMGVAGTGYGTLLANVIRCVITVIYLYKKSDMYHTNGIKAKFADYKEIVVKGIPDAAYLGVVALQHYIMMRLIINYFGDGGGVIKGVTAFAFSIPNMIIKSIQGAARPMVGLLNGLDNKKGVRWLLLEAVILDIVLGGIVVAVILIWPDLFFTLQGVEEIPAYGELSLRLFSLSFVLLGINALFRMYFTAREYHRFATRLTVVGNIAVPAIAFLLGSFFDQTYIWLSYTIAQIIILFVSLIRYVSVLLNDKKNDGDIQRIYLSVEPEEAIDASRMIQSFARENHYPERTAFRARICMEEMVLYSHMVAGNRKLRNQIMFCFSDNETRFVMLDDGECIVMDNDVKKQQLVSDNYGVIKRLASDVSYQYVLDMNYTVVSFA